MYPASSARSPTEYHPRPIEMSSGATGASGEVAGGKTALRARMREARAAIEPERREEMAREAEANLLRVPAVDQARSVLVFYSFGSEIPTAGLIEGLSARRKRILLPFLDDQGRMEAAELGPGEVPVPSGYGPKEPPGRAPVDPGQVDLVIAPGLAFDLQGHRLGYGGGHYDRYLARLGPRPVRIGIGFSVQLVDEVPWEPGDERVALVVTEQGVLECTPKMA